MQLIPRYYEAGDYVQFYDYFLSKPHSRKCFAPGDTLWKIGDPLLHVYYIESGLVQTSIIHENGHMKIMSFHGPGTVNPIGQQQDFKIENSIIISALTETKALVFDSIVFNEMLIENHELSLNTAEWRARLINRLLYEVAHQEFNSLFVKLCNLLYLLSKNFPENRNGDLLITQNHLADILAVNRVNVSKALARLRDAGIICTNRKSIKIIDMPKLATYCSLETLDDNS